MDRVLWISIGAMLGANARYWLGVWAAQRWGAAFPWGTFIINLSGSFLLGLFMTLVTGRYPVDPNLRLLVTVGFLGAYTTFSTFTYESINLFMKGQWLAGLLNVLGSMALGLLAAGFGVYLGKALS
ncbi:fluoride efflux transporter CrcB [Anaerolinea thermophila]|uniref:fluoride efflux transporter CrcB n=1 Tax=Anaerolinea thermophila TaxID=167964 RepID=UPI0026EE6CE2|nr:fluoride efflux transporter CrcB [Anaerolinea thermophila]